ncbi:MAG: hypothetical protein RL311_147 [Bacteroidota bacterium]|jgi:hypothetical protein
MIEITKTVCDFLKVNYQDVFTKSRKQNINEARQIAMYFIRKETLTSSSKVGIFFNRHHSSVLHSCKAVEDQIDSYMEFKKKMINIAIEMQIIHKNRIVYIAHPISGDIKNNVKKILEIVKEINLTEKNIVPFVPYLSDVMALDDNKPEQRNKGIRNNIAYFQSGIIKELRVYGDFISKGVAEEISIAKQLNIPVEYYNPKLQ